jgi:opacity protein-like surface antigen
MSVMKKAQFGRAAVPVIHRARESWWLIGIALGVLGQPRVAAADEPRTWGFSLELPVLDGVSFNGTPRSDNDGAAPISRQHLRVGPLIDGGDYGAQVVGMLGATYESARSIRLGARLGFAPTCWGSDPAGETHSNWRLEPFAGYAFRRESALRPFIEGGPLLASTCTGNELDQGTAFRFGLHLGAGVDYRVHDNVSLQLSMRQLASWGQYVYYSNGETGQRWDSTDLRTSAQFGFTFWL